jgi:hypothetical protein
MADIVTNVLLPGGGVVVGGVITFLCSWFFYLRAAGQLKSETARLGTLTTVVLHAMEQAELAELDRDEFGRITGLSLKGWASLEGGGSLSASATVVQGRHPPVGTPDQSVGNENA